MRTPSYVMGLIGLMVSACAETPGTAVSSRESLSGFEALVRVGRSAPVPEMSDRMSPASVRFHPGASHIEVDGDDLVTWAAFDTRAMRGVSRQDAERTVRAFVTEYQDALGVQSEELVLDERGPVDGANQLALSFGRRVEGVIVDGAFLQAIFLAKGDKWYLAEMTNRMLGPVAGLRINRGAEEPAWATVLGFQPVSLEKTEIIFPRHSAGRVTFVQAFKVELENPKSGDRYTVVYDPSSGELLEALSRKRSARVLGEVYGRSYYYKDRMVKEPLAGVTINGREIGDDGATTESGQMKVTLSSNVVRVADQGERVSFDMEISDSELVARQTDVDIAALNAFVTINRVVELVSKRMDVRRIAYFRRPVDVTVNASGTCNAFYDGDIKLFAAGGGCGNMALINDVIYHEWGHGLDDYTGTRSGIVDSAFSEGIGDIVASYMTGDPNMGPGFKDGRERGIRTAKNTARFPDDRGEAHDEGTIISGAFWDMRDAFVSRYGPEQGRVKAETIFFRHLLTTDTYQQSYQGALRIDDDDANPATRSPNYCLITEAFAAHGLATEEADCKDGEDSTRPSQDDTLHLAVLAEETNGLELAAAVGGDKTVALCFADTKLCLEGAVAANMQFLKAKGDVRFFKTQTPVNLAPGSAVTLLARDHDGKTLGYATLRLDRQ